MKTIPLVFLALALQTSLAIADTLCFKDDNFFIKKSYISRDAYTHFDDSDLKDEFQDEIYRAAYELAQKKGLHKIGDIGCGSGYKLLKYFDDRDTVGFEIFPTLDFLRRTYRDRRWELSDFETKPKIDTFDLLICSDVIEHLVNPDDLLNWIQQLNFKYLVISTPDRDLLTAIWPDDVYGPQSQSGPPVNIAHVREWSFAEFGAYIGRYFDVINHFHPENEFHGQIVIAVPKKYKST